jgi:hypothetical protein
MTEALKSTLVSTNQASNLEISKCTGTLKKFELQHSWVVLLQDEGM